MVILEKHLTGLARSLPAVLWQNGITKRQVLNETYMQVANENMKNMRLTSRNCTRPLKRRRTDKKISVISKYVRELGRNKSSREHAYSWQKIILTNSPSSLTQEYAASAWRNSWASVISSDLKREDILAREEKVFRRRRKANIRSYNLRILVIWLWSTVREM